MRASIILVLTVCFVFAGCRTVVTGCYEAVVGLRFDGFDGEETDTVLVKHYALGSGFVNPIRTDTLAFLQRSPPIVNENGLRAGEDYAVEVPATGTRVTIGNIRLSGNVTERSRQSIFKPEETFCVNRVLSFEQDGMAMAQSGSGSGDMVAIIVR